MGRKSGGEKAKLRLGKKVSFLNSLRKILSFIPSLLSSLQSSKNEYNDRHGLQGRAQTKGQ